MFQYIPMYQVGFQFIIDRKQVGMGPLRYGSVNVSGAVRQGHFVAREGAVRQGHFVWPERT